MALDIDVKLRGGEAAIDHIAFQLSHIDTVGGESAERLVKRCGNIAYLKDESGDDALFLVARPFWLPGPHDERRGVVVGGGDLLFLNSKNLDNFPPICCHSPAGEVARLRALPRRAP